MLISEANFDPLHPYVVNYWRNYQQNQKVTAISIQYGTILGMKPVNGPRTFQAGQVNPPQTG